MAEHQLDFSEDGIFDDEQQSLVDGTDVEMKRLAKLIDQQIETEDRIARLGEEMEKETKELTKLRADLIPALMKELGFTKISTVNGDVVELKPIVQASVPKEEPRRSGALKWLRDNDLGDLIKNTIRLVFGKGEDEEAHKVVVRLTADGLDVQQEISVHPQSLAAAIRERRREGKDVDTENLAVYEAEISKIVRKKKKR